MKKIPPFYVGQRVVCVSTGNVVPTASEHYIKDVLVKGNVYVVKGVRPGCCNWEVYVGFETESGLSRCGMCGNISEDGREWYMNASRFAPIHSDFQAISFEKVLETELASVN